MNWFQDKVVLITGASSGIGRALAEEAFKKGANLILCARRKERLDELTASMNQKSLRAIRVVCDVCKQEDLDRAFQEGIQSFRKIDVVIANAGFGVLGKLERLTVEDYQRQFDTNIFGVIRTAKTSLPSLSQSKGRLCIIGSVNSYLSFKAVSPYAMSKFAVRALAEALYHEWKPKGIGVTLICPGYVESEIRQVDNNGRWHPASAKPAPKALRMTAPRAAQKILTAIQKNQREKVITFHGQLGVFLQRHFPGLLHFLFDILGVKGRRGPGSSASS